MQIYEGFVPKLAYCFSFWGLRPQTQPGLCPWIPLGDRSQAPFTPNLQQLATQLSVVLQSYCLTGLGLTEN